VNQNVAELYALGPGVFANSNAMFKHPLVELLQLSQAYKSHWSEMARIAKACQDRWKAGPYQQERRSMQIWLTSFDHVVTNMQPQAKSFSSLVKTKKLFILSVISLSLLRTKKTHTGAESTSLDTKGDGTGLWFNESVHRDDGNWWCRLQDGLLVSGGAMDRGVLFCSGNTALGDIGLGSGQWLGPMSIACDRHSC